MFSLVFLAAIALGGSEKSIAQLPDPQPGVQRQQSKGINLRTAVLQKECADGDSDLFGIRLKLALTFLNIGERPTSLSKDLCNGCTFVR